MRFLFLDFVLGLLATGATLIGMLTACLETGLICLLLGSVKYFCCKYCVVQATVLISSVCFSKKMCYATIIDHRWLSLVAFSHVSFSRHDFLGECRQVQPTH